MIPEPDDHDNSTHLGALLDALTEHQPNDPNLGNPESWPREYDSIRVTTGPCLRTEDRLDTLFDSLPPDNVDELPF